MRHYTQFLVAAFVLFFTGTVHSQTFNTGSFHKVIVSPYIEATFIQSDDERVVVNNIVVDADKLHVETKNGTLRLYLDGAKEIPRNERDRESRTSYPLYPNRAVTATVYYRNLDALSLRGEERFTCESPLASAVFTLKLYGESSISFSKVNINDLHATLYGEGTVEILSGLINKQSYTCYGEGSIKATAISGEEARLTAYGESEFALNVSDRISISSFGEAKLRYKGGAKVIKGINVGGVDVARLD